MRLCLSNHRDDHDRLLVEGTEVAEFVVLKGA